MSTDNGQPGPVSDGGAESAGAEETRTAPEGSEGGIITGGSAASREERAPATSPMDSFFDPKELAPELEPAYKQMQAAFTRKTQDLAKQRQKVEQWDQLQQNPLESLQQMAQRYGFQLSPYGAVGKPTQPGQDEQPWQPETWEDVRNRIREESVREAKDAIMQQMQPYLKDYQETKKQNIEQMLNSLDPQWRLYEDEMRGVLKEHPTLVNDPRKLYRMAVPDDVLNAKATKEAMRRFQQRSEANQVSGGTTTAKSSNTGLPDAKTFSDAVAIAKARLAAEGRHQPANMGL